MSTARRDDCLRGEVTVSFNGVSHTREFAISPSGRDKKTFEPKDWPMAPHGTRLLLDDMRITVSYLVAKTSEECLRHVLYKMLGRF